MKTEMFLLLYHAPRRCSGRCVCDESLFIVGQQGSDEGEKVWMNCTDVKSSKSSSSRMFLDNPERRCRMEMYGDGRLVIQ
jgi:hypothetical protein